jgi:hypothetical protein
MIIALTQEDIDKGQPGNCSYCPWALAIQRHFPGKEVKVGLAAVRIIIDEETLLRDTLRKEIRNWIQNFDTRDGYRSFKPEPMTAEFNFELESKQ